MQVPLEPTRCLTFVSSDRPVYRPGESILFRSVTLDRRSFEIPTEVPIRFELFDPGDTAVKGCRLDGVTERGVGNGVFRLPDDAAGGTYRLVATSLDGFFPEQTLEIEVRAYRAVKLKSDIDFDRRSYTTGESVIATLGVRRADESIPAGATFKATARVEEQLVFSQEGLLNERGEAELRFSLPEAMESGDGWLTISIDDGSVVESAIRRIPIHLGKVQLNCYPEGGYLVSGLRNRVYFAARDLSGEPIEVSGDVVSQAGRRVATIESVRDGMGRFEFQPEAGQRYSIRLTKPQGMTESIWLPATTESYPVMDTGDGVYDREEAISFVLRSRRARSCLVRAVCRGQVVGVKSIELDVGETDVFLPIAAHASGVIRVTVLEAGSDEATPLIERLVFRRRQKELRFDVRHDSETRPTRSGVPPTYSPGERVSFTIEATDESGQPVKGATLGISVVDDAALSLQRKEIAAIQTHFLLTSEVESPEDLENADFYLSEGEDAALSLDLLLGTQGWRRFVSGSPGEFTETFRESLTRLLALDGQRANAGSRMVDNESTLTRQIRDYQRRAAQTWSAFWRDIRVSLLILLGVWLIATFAKPKQRSVATGGLLLLLGTSLALVGCGVQQNSSVVASRQMEDGMAMPAPADAPDAERLVEEALPMALADSAMRAGKMGDASAPGGGLVNGFARVMLNAFRGDSSRTAALEMIEQRLSEDQLKNWRNSRAVSGKELAERLLDELRFPIRQYAHVHRKSKDPTIRTDFTETLYWNPLMVTDSSGTVVVSFDLSDSITSFRLMVDGHDDQGRLGRVSDPLRTALPVEVDAKVPLEVSQGDQIDLDIGLVNSTGKSSTFGVELESSGPITSSTRSSDVAVEVDARETVTLPLKIGSVFQPVDASLQVSVKEGDVAVDALRRSIRVVPDGYPFVISRSGELTRSTRLDVGLPLEMVQGSLAGKLSFYASIESEVTSGLENMLREPHGCFEQTSSSNYPNVMIYQLLSAQGGMDESMKRRLQSLIRRGYRKLTQYECSTLGFEWFGNDPGHEALSAFGLMQFSEMVDIISVDREMMKRTRNWLLSRRDGDGGFQRNGRHLHQWSLSQDYVNAYILWAISQADQTLGNGTQTEMDFAAELDRLEQVAQSSSDAYLTAVSALALRRSGRNEPATSLLQRLVNAQSEDGSLDGITTITQSGGLSKRVETTSLAILAWSGQAEYQPALNKAMVWLRRNRAQGGFGSTQATVLALKAMMAATRTPMERQRRVEFHVDGNRVNEMEVNQNSSLEAASWELPKNVLDELARGSICELRTGGGEPLAFSLELSGRTRKPRSDETCPLTLAVRLPDAAVESEMRLGDSVEVGVELRNRTDQGLPMTMAIIGLPGGLEPVIESLEALRDDGQIDFYELRGREVLLYWRNMAPQASRRISLTCLGEIGGSYQGPASRAYLYYTSESKSWCEPLAIRITRE
ncbi:MAG: MG2 domain-containing protein [Planctomycetota bacterium]